MFRTAEPTSMNRATSLQQIADRGAAPFDLAVIGGGATGVGIAVDAASRGYSCALLDPSGFGKSRHLSKEEVLGHIPMLETSGLRGGVLYYDGQFDDARLLINLAQTAAEQGTALVNYAHVTGLHKDDDGFVEGVSFVDVESGATHELYARAVINATGAF